MKYFLFFILCVLQFWLSIPSTSAQLIRFFPISDTVLVIDGCTGPEIICSISNGLQEDSIIISPGFNTWLEYLDSTGQNHPIDKCYFLVDDSLHHFDYELWYYPRGPLPYFRQIPFDTSFVIWDEYYEVGLVVTLERISIDSLRQFFKSTWGLGIGAKSDENISDEILLYPNYPNPFNNTTAIHFYLKKRSKAKLEIYTMVGQKVSTILNDEQFVGDHFILWNATGLNSGIYYIYLSTAENSKVQKCVLIK